MPPHSDTQIYDNNIMIGHASTAPSESSSGQTSYFQIYAVFFCVDLMILYWLVVAVFCLMSHSYLKP